MKILMFGTGVIGTIYGYALAQAGQDVTHYVRSSKIPVLAGGIDLQLLDGRYNPARTDRTIYRPNLTETLSNGDGYDLVIVSVRHYQLESVLPLLKDRIGNAHVLLFSGNWSGYDGLERHMPRARFLLGFPVAGGGYRGATLDAALLNEIRLGELDGQDTARLRAIRQVFESAGIKVDIQPNMEHWLWVHFAINSAIIGAAFQAGSAERLLNSIQYLHTGILSGLGGAQIRQGGYGRIQIEGAEAARGRSRRSLMPPRYWAERHTRHQGFSTCACLPLCRPLQARMVLPY